MRKGRRYFWKSGLAVMLSVSMVMTSVAAVGISEADYSEQQESMDQNSSGDVPESENEVAGDDSDMASGQTPGDENGGQTWGDGVSENDGQTWDDDAR